MKEELNSIPSYSDDALSSLDIFFDEYNDFNFYIEDEDQENLYEIIIKKVFPTISIEKIFPLRGKKNILTHSKENISQTKNIYIIDKDFDDFLNRKKFYPNLYYLKYFCIENYLLDIDATVEFVIENNPREKTKSVYSKLNLDAFIEINKPNLQKLFKLFLLAQKYNLSIKNTKSKPEDFTSNGKPSIICNNKIEKYEIEIKKQIEKKGFDYEKLMSSPPLNKFSSANLNKIISGKFLIGLNYHHIRSNYKIGNTSIDSMCYRIAKNINSIDKKTFLNKPIKLNK